MCKSQRLGDISSVRESLERFDRELFRASLHLKHPSIALDHGAGATQEREALFSARVLANRAFHR